MQPSTSTTGENVCRLEAVLAQDRQVRIRDAAEELNIFSDIVFNIVNVQLGYRKDSTRWIPKNLTNFNAISKMDAIFFIASLRVMKSYQSAGTLTQIG